MRTLNIETVIISSKLGLVLQFEVTQRTDFLLENVINCHGVCVMTLRKYFL